MKVVYVAGPYRAPDNWQIEENVRNAERLSLVVWQLGAAALCPHANTRFFQGAAPDAVWLNGDLELISRCDALLVMPNHGKSTGTQVEIGFARERGIVTFFAVGTPERAEPPAAFLEWLNDA